MNDLQGFFIMLFFVGNEIPLDTRYIFFLSRIRELENFIFF